MAGFTYPYRRPSVTVDAVVFGTHPDTPGLRILLVRRGDEPFKGRWALPGGFVNVRDDGDQGEDLEEAVRRELLEETSVSVSYLEQLGTFGTPGRDPRGRVISVAYYALVCSDDHIPVGGDDAVEAAWFEVGPRMGLAFDHDAILKAALARLQAKVRYSPIGFHLLPEVFTVGELQRLYESILQRPLDKRNFHRDALKLGILTGVGMRTGGGKRPAQTYRFDKRGYARAVREGFDFNL